MLTRAHAAASTPASIEQVDYHRLLGETSYLLLQDVDPHTLALTVYSKLVNIFRLTAYVHYLLSPDGTHSQLVSAGGKTNIRASLGSRLELGQAVCGAVAKTCKWMHIEGVQQRMDEMTALIRSLGR